MFQVLDQLKVPQELVYRDIRTIADAEDSIKRMQVRGAPLIAMVGCLGIATELSNNIPKINSKSELRDYIRESVRVLTDARPTAVNMRKEGQRLVQFVDQESQRSDDLQVLQNRLVYISSASRISYKLL
jgi:methylthioribose-1-phosphate isomerase